MPGSANPIKTSNDSSVRLGIITPATETPRYTSAFATAYAIRPRRQAPRVQAYATAISIAETLTAWVTL